MFKMARLEANQNCIPPISLSFNSAKQSCQVAAASPSQTVTVNFHVNAWCHQHTLTVKLMTMKVMCHEQATKR